MESKIVLVGMMGSGKSEVGKKVANILGFKHVDMDEEFESNYGPIGEFFRKYGERKFRDKESELLKRILNFEKVVVSTGGGVVERKENRAILSGMMTFYLEAPLEVLWQRVKGSKRPLATNERSFVSLFEKRRPFYESFKMMNTQNLNSWEVAAKIVKETIKPSLNVEFDDFQRVKLRDNFSFPASRLTVISKKAKKIWDVEGVEVEDGESLKNLNAVEKLWELFLRHHMDRNSVVNIVGGGTVTDTVGFAAQTFMRGVNFNLIPTTLLGMADASIGGKFAVNFNGVKNLIGTFGKPLVFINPLFSLSLEDERFKEGIVEVLKIGAVYDRELFEYVEEKIKSIMKRNLEDVKKMLTMAVKDKLEVVKKDPFDKKFRHILNFGHTIAHAVESASGNAISHGHAVAIGMIVESRKFSPLIAERIKKVVDELGFEEMVIPDLERWIMVDKKRENSKLLLPVVESIGKSKLKSVDVSIFCSTGVGS